MFVRYRSLVVLAAVLPLLLTFGCGKNETVLPTTPLTEEQKLKIKAEDAAIAEEESQGKLLKPKARK